LVLFINGRRGSSFGAFRHGWDGRVHVNDCTFVIVIIRDETRPTTAIPPQSQLLLSLTR
jgi:hypothetical protein